MVRVQALLMGISIILVGLFITFFSRRLTHVLIKSTMMMGEEFGIKRTFGRGFELLVQLILIIFGIAIIFVAVRVFTEMFRT